MAELKSERINLRFPMALLKRIESFAQELGISRSEAIRYLVEEGLGNDQRAARDRASFKRMVEITEYMFNSIILSNVDNFSAEVRDKIVEDTLISLRSKHPHYFENTDDE